MERAFCAEPLDGRVTEWIVRVGGRACLGGRASLSGDPDFWMPLRRDGPGRVGPAREHEIRDVVRRELPGVES